MKIPGYTLRGNYYLADRLIINLSWKEACEMKEKIVLPNGKIVFAHTLSKKELESIPRKERGTRGFWYWYWTSTPTGDSAWYINSVGDFNYYDIRYYGGCARLGFHKNEIKNEIKKHFLDIE